MATKNETHEENNEQREIALSRLGGFDVVKSATPPANEEADDDESHSSGRGQDGLIKPLYHPLVLVQYVENSAELHQIISCMVANTVGYGWRVVPREHTLGIPDEEMLKEAIEMENFFNYVNPDQDIKDVLTEIGWDFYLTGMAYFEITRSPSSKKPDGLFRIPSHQMLMTKKEADAYRFSMKQLHRKVDGYEVKRRLEYKRFRRFSQSSLIKSAAGVSSRTKGTKSVWFKEFQDNRLYSRETGELFSKKESRKNKLAHEVVALSSPVTRGAYGFPRFIGNIIALNGDIKAENINLSTFSNNNIPSMVITCSSGKFTKGSVKRLTQFAETKFQTDDNRSRFLVLESEALGDDGDETGKSKISIESLHATSKEEMMFQKFMDEQRASVRRAFRLPAILIGREVETSGDIISASMKLADEQVFGQDRSFFVSWINRRLLPELGFVNHKLELNSPNVNDVKTLVDLLRASEKTGAMTPKIARQIIEGIMSTNYGEMPDSIDSNTPFAITMAEAVKKVNDAGGNNPTGDNQPERVMNHADPSELSQQLTSDPTGGS